jgi:pimeloyl-ACP methyl ester carboxylesterase
MPDALPTIEVPGGRVEYDDVPGSEPPLLFLHEGLGSVGLWRGLHHEVAKATGRRAVAFSRHGHGFSDPPPAPRDARFLHHEAAVVVPAVCAALEIEAPVVIGHSDGASIGLLYAAAAEVTALVVIAPHIFAEEIGLAGIAAAGEAYEHGGLREKMARHHRDPDVTFHNWFDVWTDADFAHFDLRPQLVGITCPVLAVQGTSDPYGTVAHIDGIREAAVHADVELMVLTGGHAPHQEHAAGVLKAIVRHVEDARITR